MPCCTVKILAIKIKKFEVTNFANDLRDDEARVRYPLLDDNAASSQTPGTRRNEM